MHTLMSNTEIINALKTSFRPRLQPRRLKNTKVSSLCSDRLQTLTNILKNIVFIILVRSKKLDESVLLPKFCLYNLFC